MFAQSTSFINDLYAVQEKKVPSLHIAQMAKAFVKKNVIYFRNKFLGRTL